MDGIPGGDGQDSAHFMRHLVDHVPAMLAYWDRDLRCRFANRAYLAWFGADPDNMLGRHIADLLGPDLFALNEPHMRAALAGTPQEFERAIPGPDGVIRQSLAMYLPDVVDGDVMGFVAFVTDITALKRKEEALRRSEAALREAQRLGQIGSWQWELATGVVTWSEEMYHLFGRDPSDPLPPPADRAALYAPDSWQAIQVAVADALRTGDPYRLEVQYRHASGELRWMEARGEVIRDASGATVRLQGTALDVTPRRTNEAARVQLQVAEAASRNKSDLMSRVSHELRTPLNGILGFAQLLQARAEVDPVQRSWIEAILASGRHMLALVNDVLDISAAEAGRIELRREALDVGALLGETLQRARAAAAPAGITVIGPPEPVRPASAWGDPTRLRQVLDNLLSNAVKFTPPGGHVRLSVGAKGKSLVLSVSDTGTGMDATQQARLFMPFDRLGAERTRIPGTGLGLAVTKMLVDRMDGTITVRSEPGQGTTFTVTLPAGVS
jgi:PAS domain S-box-containing protein